MNRSSSAVSMSVGEASEYGYMARQYPQPPPSIHSLASLRSLGERGETGPEMLEEPVEERHEVSVHALLLFF